MMFSWQKFTSQSILSEVQPKAWHLLVGSRSWSRCPTGRPSLAWVIAINSEHFSRVFGNFQSWQIWTNTGFMMFSWHNTTLESILSEVQPKTYHLHVGSRSQHPAGRPSLVWVIAINTGHFPRVVGKFQNWPFWTKPSFMTFLLQNLTTESILSEDRQKKWHLLVGPRVRRPAGEPGLAMSSCRAGMPLVLTGLCSALTRL